MINPLEPVQKIETLVEDGNSLLLGNHTYEDRTVNHVRPRKENCEKIPPMICT